ncbi:MAG: hypothetical protein ABW104_18710 [Candidatus Thiodiazotropha sp. 6PLUC2]
MTSDNIGGIRDNPYATLEEGLIYGMGGERILVYAAELCSNQ